MKKSVKLISLLLLVSMVLSICACGKKKPGPGAKKIDEPFKPEHEVETTLPPEPTETDPVPGPTTPAPTDTPAPTYGDISTIKDLIELSEGAIGMTAEETTNYLTQALGIKTFTLKDKDLTNDGKSKERYLRHLDKDIVVDGVTFKSIGMHVNNGKVNYISYTVRVEAILAAKEPFEAKAIYDSVYPIITNAYGKELDGYTEQWIDFTKSGVSGWQHNEYTISTFWGEGCKGEAGNDQFVLVIQYKGDISQKEPTGGGNRPDDTNPTTTPTDGGTVSPDQLTAEFAFSVIMLTLGQTPEQARSWLEISFNTKVKDPVTAKNGDGSYTIYAYACDLTIEGVKISQIDLLVGEGKDKVFNVNLKGQSEKKDKAIENYKMFQNKYKVLFGNPSEELHNNDQDTVGFKISDNIELDTGALHTKKDSRCYICIEDRSLK